jgi:glutamine cyclotransferase
VHYSGSPLHQLNELEFLNGELLATVYESNWVLSIDPLTGNVREAIGLYSLVYESWTIGRSHVRNRGFD